MAHLWLIDASEEWAILPLDRDLYLLDAPPPAPLAALGVGALDAAGAASRAALVHGRLPHGDGWVLLSGATDAVRVNGRSVPSGVRLLADRDEIRVAGRPPMFFSTELLAEVTLFPGAPQPLACPRCKLRLETGVPAIRCPQCDVWHHQSEDLPCWSYAETCATCGHRTALDAGFTWSPGAH